MKRICAWCKKELLPREELGTEREVTHGICSKCAVQLTRDVPKSLRNLLSLISEPVLIVDSQGVVKTANTSGQKLLGKDLVDIENYPGGDVIECTFASLPDGCGRTEHCKTCAIRNIVLDTLAHGRGYKNVPAFQNISTPNGDRLMRFYISTEKIDDQILLRIDDVTEGFAA